MRKNVFVILILLLGGSALCFAGPGQEGSGEKVELSFWHGRAEWDLAVADNFMAEHPNVVVELTETPPNEMYVMVQTFMAAGRGPDMMTMWEAMYLFPFHDELRDFKELLPKDKIDEFKAGWRDTSYYKFDPNEKLMGFPNGGTGFFFYYYNKAMFKDAGIGFEPTEANRWRMTWEEFTDAGEKLKAAGYTPIGWGNDGGNMTCWYWDPISYNYLQPGDYIKIGTGEKPWNSNEYLQAITRLNELVQAGYFNEGGITLDWTTGLNLVKNREAAMSMAWWGYNVKSTWEELGDDFGMMNLPVINENAPLMDSLQTSIPGRTIIPVWSAYPEIAAELAYFYSNKESVQLLYEMNGAFGPRTDFTPDFADTSYGDFERLAWEWLGTWPLESSYQNTAWTSELFAEQAGKSVELFTNQITEQEFVDALQVRMEQLEYEWLVWYEGE